MDRLVNSHGRICHNPNYRITTIQKHHPNRSIILWNMGTTSSHHHIHTKQNNQTTNRMAYTPNNRSHSRIILPIHKRHNPSLSEYHSKRTLRNKWNIYGLPSSSYDINHEHLNGNNHHGTITKKKRGVI